MMNLRLTHYVLHCTYKNTLMGTHTRTTEHGSMREVLDYVDWYKEKLGKKLISLKLEEHKEIKI